MTEPDVNDQVIDFVGICPACGDDLYWDGGNYVFCTSPTGCNKSYLLSIKLTEVDIKTIPKEKLPVWMRKKGFS